jgi:hypothetical protein
MLCPQCGEVLVGNLVQAEARLLAHRLFRHQSPAVQAVAGLAFTLLASWLLVQAVKWMD